MPRRVFVHVGSPKTGTTYLQHILWSQKDRAKEQGLLLPLGSFFDHFRVSQEVCEETLLPPDEEPVATVWDRLLADTAAWEGDVLLSHELLAPATREQASRALARFGPNTEVHVVLTARDLVRQIPAEWQEHVKHRSGVTFDAFVDELRAEDPRNWFWRVQDYADVLRRWGADLPRERVHVVTVPVPGGPPGLLWERFAGLLGLDPGAFDTEGHRANTSLGFEQAEVMRRVNLALGEQRLPWPGSYMPDVKEVFAERVLAGRPGTRLRLHGAELEYAIERSGRLVEELRALEIDLVGDLEELLPETQAERGMPLASPTDEVVLAEAVDALAGLLEEYVDVAGSHRQEERELEELRGERARLEQEVEGLRHELHLRDERVRDLEHVEAVARAHPFKHLLHVGADRWPWAGRARSVVRRTRERARRRG